MANFMLLPNKGFMQAGTSVGEKERLNFQVVLTRDIISRVTTSPTKQIALLTQAMERKEND
jgi:hypothetical protein